MTVHTNTWLSRRKWVVAAAALPVLVVAWWAFRPEKLWINEKVNEPAPFTSSLDPQTLYTGRLEGKAHHTSGRATIYKSSDGRQYLRLTDFMTSNGPDVHVLLVRSDDKGLDEQDSVELGSIKGNQGDQNYDLPGSADLNKYRVVVIYCQRFHTVFGLARLEPF
ncbi:MAG: putative secreted protein [Bryobacterales bacterium]|nr:putative secreted protein [Bryobacterales bacterium]